MAGAAKPGDKTELSKLWQQLKDDIESAMAKKPVAEGGREGGQAPGGQYKRFSVIRRQVGTSFDLDLTFLHSTFLNDPSPFVFCHYQSVPN